MNTKTTRIKAISDVGSRAEFDAMLEQIAIMQLSKEKLELRRDQKLLLIKLDYAEDIGDLTEKMEAAVLRAEKYATTHREELLPGKKKTAETGVAFFGFRTGNPTLVLLNRSWSWKKVLAELEALGGLFLEFIVVKKTIDKDLVKARLTPGECAAIGTRIEQHETFFIDPKRDPANPQRLVSPVKAAA
jgi:phage host-nuclease inhibitor protein Gam